MPRRLVKYDAHELPLDEEVVLIAAITTTDARLEAKRQRLTKKKWRPLIGKWQLGIDAGARVLVTRQLAENHTPHSKKMVSALQQYHAEGYYKVEGL